jgi:hypothetical protein
MKYKKLGKLPIETVDFFKHELLKRKIDRNYQWIWFDRFLNTQFANIFSNTDLKVQYDPSKNRFIQKAFYSDPGHGCRIHKDGIQCRSAMNIAISCNDTDWVRWYDEDLINSLENNVTVSNNVNFGYSRNCNIEDFENIPFAEELHNEVGDVYTLDVDTFHSFKCVGSEPRIIIQTKFADYPDFETISELLSKNSFVNLISAPT